MATPKALPHQLDEPCYSWNNKDNKGKVLNLETSQDSIKESRDFFNNTPKPGYKRFTYPHPLVSGNPHLTLQQDRIELTSMLSEMGAFGTTIAFLETVTTAGRV